MLVVYNDKSNRREYHGFCLSEKAERRFAELKGIILTEEDKHFFKFHINIKRHDPVLIQVIEELGEEANGYDCHLAMCEVPTGEKYRIEIEENGVETVMMVDDYEWEIAE